MRAHGGVVGVGADEDGGAAVGVEAAGGCGERRGVVDAGPDEVVPHAAVRHCHLRVCERALIHRPA
jgi:hypothetical protein